MYEDRLVNVLGNLCCRAARRGVSFNKPPEINNVCAQYYGQRTVITLCPFFYFIMMQYFADTVFVSRMFVS